MQSRQDAHGSYPWGSPEPAHQYGQQQSTNQPLSASAYEQLQQPRFPYQDERRTLPPLLPAAGTPRKRSHPSDSDGIDQQRQHLPPIPTGPYHAPPDFPMMTPLAYVQQYHHLAPPAQGLPHFAVPPQYGYDYAYVPTPHRPADPPIESMVGKEGYPPQRPHAQSRTRFTQEDDALLLELKETKKLSWRQIAEFFPGRKAGTLQVRHCTKLNRKTNNDFTEAEDKKLLEVTPLEDESKWRRVATKLGDKHSAEQCRVRFDQLQETKELEEREGPADEIASDEDGGGEPVDERVDD